MQGDMGIDGKQQRNSNRDVEDGDDDEEEEEKEVEWKLEQNPLEAAVERTYRLSVLVNMC